ncbi:YciI family protein [Mesorhizobium sp. 1M-11]|uniref:YciI family protein n=1 Tax=Mesorhizobium sp. 1M-11 TaxID=1529006 RepID=UPI0006C76A41|nr:YciI family protein [Mesorhizobium sp. 1M-11]
MLYAILAYHAAGVVESWTPEEDAAVMAKLANVRERLLAEGKLGPAARLSPTEGAFTLRGQGAGMVIDGPFAETKEQLLGFYIVDCANREEAVEAARNLRQANPTAIYEIRPIPVYLPGVAFPVTEEKES